MRLILGVAAASLLVTTPAFAAESPVSVWFDKPVEEVSAILGNLCADRNGIVIEQDNYHLLCSRTENGFKGALAQALLGNSSSTTPEVKVRFSFIRQPNSVRVVASQWIETQMAFGQVRRSELNGRRNNQNMIDMLTGLGATTVPPAPPAAAPATVPVPQTSP